MVFSRMFSVTHFVRKLHSLLTARFVGTICLQPVFWRTEMLLKQSLLLAVRHMCELPSCPDAVAKMDRALH